MWTALAGVPGKLAKLLERLNLTRAANLDNLNATITSRAPASTALSNAVWVDGLAAKINLIALHPGDMAPIAAGLVGDSRTLPSLNETLTIPLPHASSTSGAVGTVTFINITGKGVVTLAGLRITTAGSGGQEITARLRLTIDGVVHEVTSSSAASSVSQYKWTVGFLSAAVAGLDQVPFNTSFAAALVIDSRAGSGAGTAYVAYRRTS